MLGLVYQSLVRDSLLPSEPAVIARAALTADAAYRASERAEFTSGAVGEPGSTCSLPSWFGHDADGDAVWLSDQLNGSGPLWHVFRAMTLAADKPHTGLIDGARAAVIASLQNGTPQVAPGFAVWQQQGGTLVVADVHPAGSAHASGLLPGDVIEAIDGVVPRASGLEILRFYAAQTGTSVELSASRAGRPLRIDLVLRSGDVPVVTHEVLSGGVGYVNVRWFATSSDADRDAAAVVRSALVALAAESMAGVVFDLRSGMGGSLKAVIDIVSALSEATTVVAVQEDGRPVEHARSGECIWTGARVAVLVNEQSTSAAEFLAVGLEECAGAVLVGAPTSGGLNLLRFEELADGYKLVLPAVAGLGPRSLATRAGHRLEPTIAVPNPNPDDSAAAVDGQLEAARRWVVGGR